MDDEKKNDKPTETAIATRENLPELPPRNAPIDALFDVAKVSFEELQKRATYFAESIFVPQAFQKRPQDVLAAILYGAGLGLSAFQALNGMGVINGRPAPYGDTFLALVTKSPQLEDWKEATIEEIKKSQVAWCEVIRKDRQRVFRASFSFDDARRAGLMPSDKGGDKVGGKDIYNKYPERMIQWRARHWAFRDAFPEALSGLQTYEEAQESYRIEPDPRTDYDAEYRQVMPDGPEPQTTPPDDQPPPPPEDAPAAGGAPGQPKGECIQGSLITRFWIDYKKVWKNDNARMRAALASRGYSSLKEVTVAEYDEFLQECLTSP